jgi:DNA-binding CsgD family transcriptional regulator
MQGGYDMPTTINRSTTFRSGGSTANGGTRIYLVVKCAKEAAEGRGVDGDARHIVPVASFWKADTEEIHRLVATLPLADILSRLDALAGGGDGRKATSKSCGNGVGSRQPRPVAPTFEDERAPKRRLTARQCEILLALKDGATNKEIARRLGILESTVKVHLKLAYRQLRVKNRTQAAMFAIQHMAGHTKGEHRSDGTPAFSPGE